MLLVELKRHLCSPFPSYLQFVSRGAGLESEGAKGLQVIERDLQGPGEGLGREEGGSG